MSHIQKSHNREKRNVCDSIANGNGATAQKNIDNDIRMLVATCICP